MKLTKSAHKEVRHLMHCAHNAYNMGEAVALEFSGLLEGLGVIERIFGLSEHKILNYVTDVRGWDVNIDKLSLAEFVDMFGEEIE